MEIKGCDSFQEAERKRLTRRTFVAGGLVTAALWATSKTALAQTLFRENGNVVVVIFLRGGADGLNVIAPYAEDAYYRLRPSLAIPAPGSGNGSLIKLDDTFAFNPFLAPLHPLYDDGVLGVVHAAGSHDTTHSHFEAMSAMERGANSDRDSQNGGWLARHLSATTKEAAPMRAVAFTPTMPESLSGATQAIAIESLADYRIDVPKDKSAQVEAALADLYKRDNDVFAEAGRNTLHAVRALRDYDPKKSAPEHGAAYPDSSLGNALAQVAYLVRKDVGLEVACLDAADRGGWDTHVAQAVRLDPLLDDLGKSLAAFHQDLGKEMSRVTVVVQTEFGRRVAENTGYGTDHGAGSFMLAMGGGVKGGRVVTDWPGLEDDSLSGPGDLKVTTDYRNVMAEMLETRLGNNVVHQVFPDLQRKSVGLFV
ncbi:MAG TPA: DUF1501 domain-containing protein [Fimbriimonadaceae bacterium]|nr:DUF1501 domain-containing protein [Fimbriimonadaceae bacterium]